MPDGPDPFQYHPELRDKISDPEASFFRTFNATEFARDRPEFTSFAKWIHSDEVRECLRAEFFSEKFLIRRADQDIWVFAYGSLMWDPAFLFSEVRRAYLPGYARQFILLDKLGGRGSETTPGLMAALDYGVGCNGLLFRIPAPLVERESQILWQRELAGPAYLPAVVDAQVGDRTVPAITFVADHSAPIIRSDLTLEEKSRFICTGKGFLGTSLEYLTNIATQFKALNIDDDEVNTLMEHTRSFMASRD